MAAPTVGDIWTRIKERTDLAKSGASGYVTDQEGIRLVQLGVQQLQNLVMDSYEYWVSRYVVFTTVANQISYPINQIGMPDFYKLLGMGIITPGTTGQDTWLPLRHFDMHNMGIPAGGFFQFTSGGFGSEVRFKLLGGSMNQPPTIELRSPKSAMTIGVYYVPRPPQFSSLNDVLPPWIMPSWEEYPVAFASWMIAAKEQSGMQTHKEIWMMIRDEIQNFAPNRDSFAPTLVTRGWNVNREFMLGSYY